MSRRFEVLGDGRVIAFGATLPELFENAGFAVFNRLYDLSGVSPQISRPLVAPGDEIEELLVNWIDGLVALGEEEGLALSYFVVDRLEEGGVQGSAAGRPAAEVAATGLVLGSVSVEALASNPDGFWVRLRLGAAP